MNTPSPDQPAPRDNEPATSPETPPETLTDAFAGFLDDLLADVDCATPPDEQDERIHHLIGVEAAAPADHHDPERHQAQAWLYLDEPSCLTPDDPHEGRGPWLKMIEALTIPTVLLDQARWRADQIRDQAFADAETYTDAALRAAADTVRAARQEAEAIVAAARAEAHRITMAAHATARAEAETPAESGQMMVFPALWWKAHSSTTPQLEVIDLTTKTPSDPSPSRGSRQYWPGKRWAMERPVVCLLDSLIIDVLPVIHSAGTDKATWMQARDILNGPDPYRDLGCTEDAEALNWVSGRHQGRRERHSLVDTAFVNAVLLLAADQQGDAEPWLRYAVDAGHRAAMSLHSSARQRQAARKAAERIHTQNTPREEPVSFADMPGGEWLIGGIAGSGRYRIEGVRQLVLADGRVEPEAEDPGVAPRGRPGAP